MKIAILADTHWGKSNDNHVLIQNQTDFFRDVFFPTIIDRGITRVIHLGDVFDRRSYANVKTVRAAWDEMMSRFITMKLDVHIIVGNHDVFYKNTNDLSSVRTFYEGMPSNIEIYEEPYETEFDGVKFLFLPWIPEDSETEHQFMKKIEASKAQVCVTHVGIVGFDMYRGIPGSGGLDPAVFNKFQAVFSGHYHTKSVKGNICYVGATCQYTWNDYDDDRGFSIYDTETMELEFIRNPNEAFCKVHYDDKVSDPKTIAREIEEADVKGKFVKLIVRNKQDALLFDRIVDKLESRGLRELKVVDDHFHADDITDDEIAVDVGDTLALIESLIDREGKPELADAAKMLARDLYEEAVSIE